MQKIIIGNREIIPSKIVCIARNYYEHIKELGNEIPNGMVFFSKPNSAISNELQSYHQEQLHYEGELCFLFEKNHFTAIGFGLDLTKRKLQSRLKERGLPWERAKAFDGAAVFSDFVKIPQNYENLVFDLKINGKSIQHGTMDLMIYKPERILAEILTFMTLNDGDIVMTGTPKGVGVINKSDVFEAVIKQNTKTLLEKKWIAV